MFYILVKCGLVSKVEFFETDNLSLDLIYKKIDADTIDIVPCYSPLAKQTDARLIIDDNGKLFNKSPNFPCTCIYGVHTDFIAGDAILCRFNGVDDVIGFETKQDAIRYFDNITRSAYSS